MDGRPARRPRRKSGRHERSPQTSFDHFCCAGVRAARHGRDTDRNGRDRLRERRNPRIQRRPPPIFKTQAYRRAEGNSLLTYPEWYIVHAYTDLAGVTRQSSEVRYKYGTARSPGFWTSLCRATETARKIGPVTVDQRITNYVIGVELFPRNGRAGQPDERSIGALTALMRGDKRTPRTNSTRAFWTITPAFLQQTPWYEHPFKATLVRFWRETPGSSVSLVRSLERRFALSLEYGLKGLYAVAYRRARGLFASPTVDHERHQAARRRHGG